MGLMGRIYACFHSDCCGSCQSRLKLEREQLYALPCRTVDRYVRCDDAGFYKRALVKVKGKADIPTGMYACRVHRYRCPMCGKKMVRLTVFLPVRDEEMVEQILRFEDGEMDGFI